MKLNRKTIIPAFALLAGAALAGSVSSTIAWYQYSTRTNVAYLGTSAGTSGNLQVRIKDGNYGADGDWGTQISYNDVDTFLESKKIAPITSGEMDKDDALPDTLYANPIAGFGPLSQWKTADATSYVVIPLQFRFIERDGSRDNGGNLITKQKEHDIYLTDLFIGNDYTNATNAKRDLSSAVRVHFDAYDDAATPTHAYRLASKNGGDTAVTGNLDLDNDGELDKIYTEEDNGAQYGFGGDSSYLVTKGTIINYGERTGTDLTNKQVAYSASDLVGSATAAKLGSTSATDGKYLNVDVTIWLEGWHRLPKANDSDPTLSSIWDYAKTIDSKFDVGMQFAAKTAE